MDIYKLKFTTLQNEIFRLLSIKAGELLNKREIANNLKVSPTAVAKALPLLEKEGLIKIDKSKKINLDLVELNRDNEETIEFKKIENLKLIWGSGLTKFLQEEFPGATTILFGSYARGEDIINSDIDIAVIGVKEKDFNFHKLFYKVLEREININFYDNLNKIDKHLRNNILNGIVLTGGINL